MHQRYPPHDPREWLNRARSNLAIADLIVSISKGGL